MNIKNQGLPFRSCITCASCVLNLFWTYFNNVEFNFNVPDRRFYNLAGLPEHFSVVLEQYLGFDSTLFFAAKAMTWVASENLVASENFTLRFFIFQK